MRRNNILVLILSIFILISLYPAIGAASPEDTSIESGEDTNTDINITNSHTKSNDELRNQNLSAAPTPPRDNSKNATNGENVISYNAQNNTVTRQNTSDLTLFGTASVNGSVKSTPSFHPMDRSTSPDGDRVRIDNTQNFPWRPIVQLRIDGPDADNKYDAACSGTLISDNQVLTAAHCVYFYDDQGNPEGYVDSITAVPGANNASADSEPFGKARMEYIKTYTGWTDNQNYDYDLALITLDRDIGMLTGWFGYATFSTDSSAYTSSAHATGYPGNPPSSSYPTMWDHFDSGVGTSSCDVNNCLTHEYWMITTSGQSGGPVWKQDSFGNGNRHILSVISGGFDDSTEPNVGTRITDNRYDDIGSWITETDNLVTVDNRPELADSGSDSRNYYPDSIAVGEDTLNIEQKVVNKGPEEAGCFDVTFYLATDPQIASTYNRLGDSTICSLSPAEEMTAEWNGIVPVDVSSGEYVVVSSIDQDDAVSEYDEYPNVKTFDQTLTIQPSSSFNVEITSTNSPVVAGDSLNVTATVENTGDSLRTKDIELDVPGIGNDSTSLTLAGGESQDTTLSVSTSEGDNGTPTIELSTPDDSTTRSIIINEQSAAVELTNVSIDPGTVAQDSISTHNLSFDALHVSADDEPDEFTITIPESVSVEAVNTVVYEYQSGDGGGIVLDATANSNEITFQVNPDETVESIDLSITAEIELKVDNDTGDQPTSDIVLEDIYQETEEFGEYVVFTNTGGSAVDMSGWKISDEADHTYTVPSGFTLDPGEDMILYTGSGTNEGTALYWGEESTVWNNNGTITVEDKSGTVVLQQEY